MLVTSPIPTDIEDYYESDKYQSHFNHEISLSNIFYNYIKNISFKHKESIFRDRNKNKSVLDIGAGNGAFLHFCKKKKYQVLVWNPTKKLEELLEEKGVILESSIERVTSQQYDVITMWHSLEHVLNLLECLDYLKKDVKKRGKINYCCTKF